MRLLLLTLSIVLLGLPARADERIEFDHAGFRRSATLYLPPRQDGPVALVVLLHGAGGSGRQALASYGWPELAERAGFAVLAPDALPARPDRAADLRNNPRFWADGTVGWFRGAIDDSGFVMAAIEQAAARIGIDRRRIFAAGHSSGSGMAQRLGLDHADRIAAIAVVAGQRPQGGPLKRPLPVLYFAGGQDKVNPVEGGMRQLPWGPPSSVPPLSESIEGWARDNGCAAPERLSPERQVTLTRWSRCQGGAEVTYYLIADLGHQWPGGRLQRPLKNAQSSTSIAATPLAWDFFQRHPLPAPG